MNLRITLILVVAFVVSSTAMTWEKRGEVKAVQAYKFLSAHQEKLNDKMMKTGCQINHLTFDKITGLQVNIEYMGRQLTAQFEKKGYYLVGKYQKKEAVKIVFVNDKFRHKLEMIVGSLKQNMLKKLTLTHYNSNKEAYDRIICREFWR